MTGRQKPPVRIATVTVGTNELRWLGACLESLLASDAGGVELTVWYVDNASRDGSAAFVRGRFPQVRVIGNSGNLGFARANNIGMRAALDAGADYVFLVNPDTRTPPDLIAALVAFGEAWPEYGIFGPMQHQYEADEPKVLIGEYNNWSRTALRWGEQHAFAGDWPDRPSPASPSAGRAPGTLEHAYVQGAALVARAEALRAIGLFDPVFHTYYEETDLCRRARWGGWRVALVVGLGIQHYGGGGTAGNGRYRRVQMRRNRYYYLLTDVDWRPLSALRLAGRWLRADLRGRSVSGRTSTVRGIWETVRALAWLADRAGIMRHRRRSHRYLRSLHGPVRPGGGA
jgi:GT2 family glycosyltransferase